MKYISKATFALILSLTLFSCHKKDNISNDIINSIEIEGLVAFNLESKKVSLVKKSNKLNKNNTNLHSIKHIFTFEENTFSFSSEEEMKSYLLENAAKVNGKYEIFVDGVKEYSVQIVNGKKTNQIVNGKINQKNLKNKISKTNSCSFKEVKSCAIQRIHDQNWFDMTLCIIEGLGCVINNYVSCAVDLC